MMPPRLRHQADYIRAAAAAGFAMRLLASAYALAGPTSLRFASPAPMRPDGYRAFTRPQRSLPAPSTRVSSQDEGRRLPRTHAGRWYRGHTRSRPGRGLTPASSPTSSPRPSRRQRLESAFRAISPSAAELTASAAGD